MFTNYTECLKYYLLFPDKITVLAKPVGKYLSFKLTTASIVFCVLFIVLLTSLISFNKITIKFFFEKLKICYKNFSRFSRNKAIFVHCQPCNRHERTSLLTNLIEIRP